MKTMNISDLRNGEKKEEKEEEIKMILETETLEKNFREELEVLLKKHNAEIGLVQRGSAYMEYEVIEVDIEATYDTEGNMLSLPFEFLL